MTFSGYWVVACTAAGPEDLVNPTGSTALHPHSSYGEQAHDFEMQQMQESHFFFFYTTVHGLTSQTSHAPLGEHAGGLGPAVLGSLTSARNHSTALVFPPCTARHKPARRHDTDGTAQYGTERLCLSLAFERQLGSQFPSPPVMEGSSSPCSSQLREQRRNLCPGAQIVQHEESLGLLRARRLGLPAQIDKVLTESATVC